MAKYQVWKKEDLGQRKGMPVKEHFTLDEAMRTAKNLSVGSQTKQVWDAKVKSSTYPWGGGMVDVVVPDSLAVIERGDKQSITRGWGIGGTWFDAKECKRCSNTGQDKNSYQEACGACKGSSFRPKI